MDDEKQLNDKKENNRYIEEIQKIESEKLRIENEHKAEEHRIKKEMAQNHEKIIKQMENEHEVRMNQINHQTSQILEGYD